MIDQMKETFWITATQLVDLIIPVTVVILFMGIVTSLVLGRR